MNNIVRIGSGAPWESIVGYCRLVKAGDIVEVAGTTAVEQGAVQYRGDAYGQTKFILNKIKTVLEENGYSMNNVLRTRMFVTDISQWQEYGRAHGEFFSEHPPVTSMVEVSGLVEKDMLIEIEATVYAG